MEAQTTNYNPEAEFNNQLKELVRQTNFFLLILIETFLLNSSKGITTITFQHQNMSILRKRLIQMKMSNLLLHIKRSVMN